MKPYSSHVKMLKLWPKYENYQSCQKETRQKLSCICNKLSVIITKKVLKIIIISILKFLTLKKKKKKKSIHKPLIWPGQKKVSGKQDPEELIFTVLTWITLLGFTP